MRSGHSVFSLFALVLIFLGGCATQGGGHYSVGPGSILNSSKVPMESTGLSVIVPVFDPGIPADPDDYEELGVWPELRRAEANRFAVKLKGALEDTGAFEGVRVAPTAVATGHLYVMGEIIESNGENVEMQITVVDISGDELYSEEYSHRVKEYAIDDPRKANKDLYGPIFTTIAEDLAYRASRLSDNRVTTIQEIERVRYGEAFSPEYFSQFIETSSNGKVELVSAPAPGDPMVRRIEAVRVKDQMFLDGVQSDYLTFKQEMDADYIPWQRMAFVEAKAAREAKTKAIAQKVLGTLAIIGGVAMAANADYYDTSSIVGGAAVATAGAAAVSAGVKNSKQAEMHTQSLNELGKSLNIELAPRVMQLEDQEVELEGTLKEQYSTWRSFLKEFYAVETTPERVL